MTPEATSTSPSIRPRRAAWMLALALAALLASPLRAEVAKEHELKAAFLYNFTKFVEWPASRAGTGREPFVIAVIGESPIKDEIILATNGRDVKGHPIVVIQISDLADAGSAHVVFVARDSAVSLSRLREIAESAGVLTIGETRAFADNGGIITFTTDGGRVRFEINLASSNRAGLRISAQLLKLATGVRKAD